MAGKPAPALVNASVQRVGARRPLMIGDRLDTDIEGGRVAGMPTLLVLTGVSDAAELLAARRNAVPTTSPPILPRSPTTRPTWRPDRGPAGPWTGPPGTGR